MGDMMSFGDIGVVVLSIAAFALFVWGVSLQYRLDAINRRRK